MNSAKVNHSSITSRVRVRDRDRVSVPMVLFHMLVLLSVVVSVSGGDTLVGTIVAKVLSTDDQHIFVLNPSEVKCDSFLFAFKQFSITGSAQLQMYDEGISSPFFNCVACGSIVPPVFYSSTGVVTVQVNGVGGAGFTQSSFELQYIGRISDPHDEDIIQNQTNFELVLNMPYGHIRPVLMGGKYLAGLTEQTWVISVNAPRIQFYLGFLNFEADSDGNCAATLFIYDGLTTSSTILFSGCNGLSDSEEFIYASSGNAMVVLRSSTSAIAEVDFLLDYIADDELYHCGSATTPDILESNSMTIVDGSKSTNLMRRGESCEWLISPIAGRSVTLLMNWVSLKPGASVVVYDNDEENGVVLWDSSGTFTTVPPPLTSSGNNLYVVYSGNSLLATNYFGFNGDYYSRHEDSKGTGSTQELYSMSSAIGVTLPDLVSGKYRENLTYSFLLQPQSSSGNIYIIINQLNISDCDDSIKVYDGLSNSAPLLSTLCGDKVPVQWIQTTSGVALLEFNTDADQQRTGNFDFSFFSDGPNYHCGFPTNPAVLTSSSMIFTDGSSSTESLYGNQYCEWIIEPEDSDGLVLYFERLDLSGGGSLKIYDGIEANAPILMDISSVAAIPVSISSALSNKMKLVFASSFQAESDAPAGVGFSATYFNINKQITGPGSDNVIKLYFSSSNSLGLPIPINSHHPFANNYTFLIKPSLSSSESLYIQILNVSIAQCTDSLQVLRHDKSESLMTIDCNNSLDMSNLGFWLEVAAGTVVVEFTSLQSQDLVSYTQSSFDIAYFSQGSSQHCGIRSNPGRLGASSMPFSDGSGYGQQMHGGDHCEWIIGSKYPDISGDSILHYVIEFSENDLRGGGEMFIYDGDSDQADLLWHCDSCTEIPNAMVTSTNVAFIRFYSPPVENINDNFNYIGEGFHANYWGVKESDNVTISKSSEDFKLMAMPDGYAFEQNSNANGTSGWLLGISEEFSTLIYAPSYTIESQTNFNSDNDTTYLDHSGKQMKASISSCGFVQGSRITTLKGPDFSVSANQVSAAHADTVQSNKRILSLIESYEASPYIKDNITAKSSPVVASSSCTYRINSGRNYQSASLFIQNLNTRVAGRLRVFGGIYGYDHELFDGTRNVNGALKLFLPCGRGTVMLDSNLNETEITSDTELDYYFEMSYVLTEGDNGTDCAEYIEKLFGGEKKENFFVKYASAFVILFIVSCACCVCATCPEKIPRSWKDWYKRNYRDIKKMYQVARAPQPHPRFTPKIDGFRNKYLLRKGECCVCKVNTEKVLKLSCCNHVICLEDLNGYICTALGDVSMFPLKCPMHFEDCLATITPLDAKRVLLEPQYDKFLEFTDRGLYGEGMRCIFCANYVKFPASTKLDQMRCRKCVQSFCIRCKGPWHYGRRCVVDAIDETLESWKTSSGAQKCPGCSKLIEKDDPATCHHMIHKISDGIPCCRERTDFCYLCGIEVRPDYPHDEVKNPGVNHFPEGVFQRCRTIINKERDIEREFLRKSKRRKNNRANGRVLPVEFDRADEVNNFTIFEEGTVDLATESPAISSDPFDVMWGDSPVRNRIDAEFSEYA